MDHIYGSMLLSYISSLVIPTQKGVLVLVRGSETLAERCHSLPRQDYLHPCRRWLRRYVCRTAIGLKSLRRCTPSPESLDEAPAARKQNVDGRFVQPPILGKN